MKRYTVVLIILLALSMGLYAACAEEFDAAGYSYEELQLIRQKVDDRIAELDRQQAIEQADRLFVFKETEKTVAVKQTVQQDPDVILNRVDAPKKTQFTWASSDPAIAAVSDYGKVTGIAQGDAVITATAADNEYIFGSYTVHVIIPVEKITVWGQDTPLLIGNDPEGAAAELGYTIEPEDADYQGVIWTSSDETVVTVDENGAVRGLNPGKAVITATSTEAQATDRPAVSATFTVTVQQAVTGLEPAEKEKTLFVGEKWTPVVTVLPEDAANQAVVFRSSDPEVAVVDERGQITAVSCGECEIICEAADGNGAAASCRLTVIRQVSSLEIAEKEIRLSVGGTYAVETVIAPEDATNKALRWSSSNVFVARVADGRIEGIGQGDCVITCMTTDGTDLSAQVKVRIPTFCVDGTAFTVTEKEGLEIRIHTNGEGTEVLLETEAECFRAETEAQDVIRIIPVSAGTGTITLSNPEAPEDTLVLEILVENSAVYNQVSYPSFEYAKAVTYPELYEGTALCVTGKVMQIIRDDKGNCVVAVGTGGEKFTDEVLQVRCEASLLPEGTVPGVMLTVYGTFHMETDYSEMLEAETQVPAMTAEKIEKTE